MPEITAHHGIFRKTQLHLDDTGGNGRPVVLIHGWPLYGEAWSEQVPALAEAGYRVITYDRRGFGRSDKPRSGYDYDTLAEDLHTLLEELDLTDVTLVGFSMGGGEVARYMQKWGGDRVRSVVFAAAVPPYLLTTDDNPEGPLSPEQAASFNAAAEKDMGAFLDEFMEGFLSVGGELKVSEAEHRRLREMCDLADEAAILGCMKSWATTDFRNDLQSIAIPTLVLHGDSDATVPFEGSGKRTHEMISGSEVTLLQGAPHGCNASHVDQFNRALLGFLA